MEFSSRKKVFDPTRVNGRVAVMNLSEIVEISPRAPNSVPPECPYRETWSLEWETPTGISA